MISKLQVVKLVYLCLAITLFTACESHRLSPLSYSDTILAFGDSLTAGVGTDRETSYPAILQELSGRTVINAGISGETTSQGLKRFASVLDEYNPQLVILIEGGNDILRNVKPVITKNNLDQMIQIAKARNIDVVLLGIPEKNIFSQAAPHYQELADQHELAFDKSLMAELLKSPNLKSDPIHLNTRGYEKMAIAIYDLLKGNGAL